MENGPNSTCAAAPFLSVEVGASSGRGMARAPSCAWNGNAFSGPETHCVPLASVQAVATSHLPNLDQVRATPLHFCEFQTFNPQSGIGWDAVASRFMELKTKRREPVRVAIHTTKTNTALV